MTSLNSPRAMEDLSEEARQEVIMNVSRETSPGPSFSVESTLPEIRIMILERMPNIESLSALVHASPAYHTTYLDNRERIWTAVTLRDIWDHRTHAAKFLPFYTEVHTYLRNHEVASPKFKSAYQSVLEDIGVPVKAQIVIRSPIDLRCLYKKAPYLDMNVFAHALGLISGSKTIKLSVEHCRTLLKLNRTDPTSYYQHFRGSGLEVYYEDWLPYPRRRVDRGVSNYHVLMLLHDDEITVAGTFDLDEGGLLRIFTDRLSMLLFPNQSSV